MYFPIGTGLCAPNTCAKIQLILLCAPNVLVKACVFSSWGPRPPFLAPLASSAFGSSGPCTCYYPPSMFATLGAFSPPGALRRPLTLGPIAFNDVLPEKNKVVIALNSWYVSGSEALVTPADWLRYPKWGHDPPFGNHCCRSWILEFHSRTSLLNSNTLALSVGSQINNYGPTVMIVSRSSDTLSCKPRCIRVVQKIPTFEIYRGYRRFPCY